MSLLVSLFGTNGVVLGTDSRGTFGDPRGVTAHNDLIKKLYLANKRVGILVAGAGDLGSTVVSRFLALPNIVGLGVTELTSELRAFACAQFRQWFESFAIKPSNGDFRPPRPELNFIIGGLEMNDQPKIYRMSSSLEFAPMLHNHGFGIDGVSQYALYLLSRLYDPTAVVDDLQDLAAHVISETASQDGKVGGAIQMATITAKCSRILDIAEVENILIANRERSRALKESFLMRTKRLNIKPPEGDAEPVVNGLSEMRHFSPTPSVSRNHSADAEDSSSIPEDAIGSAAASTRW
jgi:20S proteasome alpha/beta subunit